MESSRQGDDVSKDSLLEVQTQPVTVIAESELVTCRKANETQTSVTNSNQNENIVLDLDNGVKTVNFVQTDVADQPTQLLLIKQSRDIEQNISHESVIYQVIQTHNTSGMDNSMSDQVSVSDLEAIASCATANSNVIGHVQTNDANSEMLASSGIVIAQEVSSVQVAPQEVQVTDSMRIYQCDLCSATFNRQGNYMRHRLIHSVLSNDDYRYSCGECGRLFLQKCDLKRHESVHSGSEPYRCTVCSKGYIRQSDLRVHMRFHNKERNQKCEHCEKAFYQSGDLKRHIRLVHLQQKPLTCGHCTRRFVKEATLIRHMQTTHRDIIMKSLNDHGQGQG